MKWQLSLLLLACFYTATAQEVNWDSIQSDIFKKRNLVDVFNQLEATKQTAESEKDEITVARAWYHQMQIQDQRNEDSAYFSNSYFIDSILTDGNCSLLMRSMMLVLKAKRVAKFRQQFFWNNRKNLLTDAVSSIYFRLLNANQLDSLTQLYLEDAKHISLQLNSIEPNKLLWLSTDPLLFLFKPSFTDIIYGEQLNYAAIVTYSYSFNSLPLLEKHNAELFGSDASIPANLQTVFNIYKQWALFHQGEPDKFLFIELLAKKFLFDHDVNKFDEKKNQPILAKLFEHYSASVYSIVKAYSVFQLATTWYELGHNYSKSNEFEAYYLRNNSIKFDTAYQLYYNKALSIISANDHLLDSFYYLKKNLITIKESILKKDIEIKWKRISLPQQAIPLYIKFKNVVRLYCRFIKLNSGFGEKTKERTFFDLLKLSPISQLSIALPVTDDHQLHAVNVSVPGLSAGNYAMLYSDKENPEDSTAISGSFYFSCSNIAAISNDRHVFLLNRTTGRPIPNSTLLVEYTKHYKDSVVHNKRHQLNKNGTARITESFIKSSYAFAGNDTLKVRISESDDDLPDDVYDKESDDDLLSFYEDHMELHLFTDRAIYRPGQKVFFKGILMTNDPKTGEKIVVSKKNLKFPILQKLFNSEVRDLWKDKLALTVEDPFNKTTDSFNLKLNEYGSFSGSFQLKSDAPTGEWDFDTDIIDIANQNDGSFKVEEYKRPTFEISLEKPTTFLQMGDSFAVNVKVKSFAGAQLNNVEIDYEATASFSSFEIDSVTGKEAPVSQQYEIHDSTGYTDGSGNLLIKVPAGFLKNYKLSNEGTDQIRYYIHANAIDGTGESHEEELNLTLSNRPVKIDMPIQKAYEKNELKVLSVTAKNEFAGSVNKEVEAKLFSLEAKPLNKKESLSTDYELVNGRWIFKPAIETKNTDSKEMLVYQAKLITNKDKLNFPDGIFNTGKYRLEIICRENGKIIGEKKASFEIFDRAANTYVKKETDFHYLPKNGAAKGGTTVWLFGSDEPVFSIYHAQYYAQTKNGIRKKNVYEIKDSKNGINDYSFRMPEDAFGEVDLTHLYVLNDQLYKEKQTIYLSKKISEEPQIIVEQYRKKLAPGAKERFAVSIKTKNENLAAELMTVMYDATLDKLEKFNWRKPELYRRLYLNDRWTSDINNWENNAYTYYQPILEEFNNNVQPLWWINPLDYSYKYGSFTTQGEMYVLGGRVSGVSITDENALSERVVVGYGTKKKDITGAVSVIKIRGAASVDAINSPLIIIDGITFTGDFNKFNTDLITDAVVLTGADATALYGSKATNGVILISTKGPLVLPKPEEPVIKIRKNFSETAFFYPQLHADADGFFKIDFTMPESVTQWNWKLLAHTKDAKFIFAERNIVTQLPLMVQPNMPRFLYQGDSIVLQARISNLDTAALNGVLNCVVEDAVTGENISNRLIKNNGKQISVDANSNTNGFVNLTVPEGFIHPLKITVSVSAGAVSDGEEYTIPVMSKKILVTQSQAFAVDKNSSSRVVTPVLPADAVPYGVSMYIKPKPQTALINALPYLAFYQYNCAEQTFNKMLAYAMAIHLAQKDSAVSPSMQAVDIKEDAVNPVADELSEETMPWMLLNHSTQVQQQRLKKLMDTITGKTTVSKYLKEIAALQKPDGGISWFSGGESSDYISCYLLGGFGKLKRDKISFLFNDDSTVFAKLLPALVRYADTNFIKAGQYNFPELFYMYNRCFWKATYPLSAAVEHKVDSLLTAYWKNADGYDLRRQALLVLTSLQFDHLKDKALKQLESIRQLAIADNTNGIRWKSYSNEDDFSSSDEETIALLAEAFEATDYSKATVDGILQWLLRSKEQHNWSTTKATAAVVNLLQRNQQTATGLPATIQSAINKSALTVTDNLFSGQLFSFTETNSFQSSLTVSNDNNINATGGFNFYYFSAEPPANKAGSVVNILKQQYRFNKEKDTWEEINDNTILKIADKIKTVLTITASKQLKYVFIDDKKAAALEPAEGAGSGYQYGDHINYYQSIRDAGMQFFAASIPSGVSSISYETVVATEGKFYGGTTSLQCMYQPQVRAYAKSGEIKVVK